MSLFYLLQSCVNTINTNKTQIPVLMYGSVRVSVSGSSQAGVGRCEGGLAKGETIVGSDSVSAEAVV